MARSVAAPPPVHGGPSPTGSAAAHRRRGRTALGGWHAASVDVGSLAALSVLLTWNLLRDGLPLSLDSSTQYWPWYAYLGQSLRSGRIPAWNPSAFGGTPFAADPLSGWTYLPAMSIFAALPPGAAIATFVFAHFSLAGVATVALARALGLPRSATLLAGALYAGSGFFQFQSVAAQPYIAVAAWLPVSLLGAERALHAGRADARWAWWSLAGLALSQVIAVWPGQGAYYAILMFAAWSTGRALALPATLAKRFGRALPHLAVPLVLAVGLAAAGILPRLELQPLSNLANGYAPEDQVGGWQLVDYLRLATPGAWYVGIVTLGLALVGMVALAGRYALSLWERAGVRASLERGCSALTRGPHPRCARFNPLPKGEAKRLPGLDPRRLRDRSREPLELTAPVNSDAPFILLAALWLAVLVLTASTRTPLHVALAAVLPGFSGLHAHIPERILVVGFLAPALLAGLGFAVLRSRLPRNWPAALAAAAACLDLLFAGRFAVDRQVGAAWDPLTRIVAFEARLAPDGAASFLRAQPAQSRYFGYDADGPPYTLRFSDARTRALLVDNSALSLGLLDIQGYDAVHLARFDAYLQALNAGRTQNYHDGQVFEPGLRSPLLDLLGVRFIVLPRDAAVRDLPVVFQDDWTRVVERPSALPRGWLVHDARQTSRDEALRQLGSGAVDPRRTVLVEESLTQPVYAAADDGSGDQVTLVFESPEAMRWQVATDAAGVLVMSEGAYPAWVVDIDGQRVPVLTADGLLRAVAVSAGQHVVDVRYESATLNAGIAISLATLIAVGAVFARASLATWRR